MSSLACDPDQIEVILHPESLIHSMVGFRDGAIMAHMGAPDMRHSIGYALNWPVRAELPVARLDLALVSQPSPSAPPIWTRYPALRLCREVMATRGLAGAAFNAAKEVALDHFLAVATSASCRWPGRCRGYADTRLQPIFLRCKFDALTLEDITRNGPSGKGQRAGETARHIGRRSR